jgi:hypothetical protein
MYQKHRLQPKDLLSVGGLYIAQFKFIDMPWALHRINTGIICKRKERR